MTLISWSTSAGSQGRCDAKCHTARPGSSCTCICAGRYHAAGAAPARRLFEEDMSTGRFGADIADAWRAAGGTVHAAPVQMELAL